MTKRWLCICEGGLNRSHALVYVLKCLFGQDAIAAGWTVPSVRYEAGWRLEESQSEARSGKLEEVAGRAS
jgi:hypothetical protein